MSWQDAIFSTGTLAFAIALLPAIRARRYPPPSTCFVTGGFLFLFAIADASLDLWFAMVFSFLSALLWVFMGVRSLKTGKIDCQCHEVSE